MTATLLIHYEDGSTDEFKLDHVVEIKVPKASLEFSANSEGRWTMRVSTGLTLGRKLATEFLTVRKNV